MTMIDDDNCYHDGDEEEESEVEATETAMGGE